MNEQRLAAGESLIDNFNAEDLKEKVGFNELLEAIQHVNIEPTAKDAVAAEVDVPATEEPDQFASPILINKTVDFSGRNRSPLAFGVNVLTDDPDHDFQNDL